MTSEDLVLSEDEAGNTLYEIGCKNEETTAVNKRQLVEIEDGDSDCESLAARYRNAPDEFLYTGEDEKPPSYTH